MADPVLPLPDRLVELPDGRCIALDDRGDPDGVPVLFVHGTPDSRLARHPDDGIARRSGVRLLAVDRPGIGASDVDPAASPASVADDLADLLDQLGLDRVGVLSWSAGSITALSLAGRHPDRIRSLVLIAPLVPADAYGEPDVLVGAGDSRRLFADHLGSVEPDELGRELAPWLVPPQVDPETARAMLDGSLHDLAAVDGAVEAMVSALVASVTAGMTGMEREIAAQATPLGPVLDAVRAPVVVHVGSDDTVTPPPMAAWLAHRLDAALEVHPGAGHGLALTAWPRFLAAAAAPSAS